MRLRLEVMLVCLAGSLAYQWGPWWLLLAWPVLYYRLPERWQVRFGVALILVWAYVWNWGWFLAN